MVRVSSAAIRLTSPSTRRARSVMSSRLPMGVPTIYSVPMVGRILLLMASKPGTLLFQADVTLVSQDNMVNEFNPQ